MNKEMATARILQTGPGTSIQDLGRMVGSKYGIPTSGVMDPKSYHWVNHVLQNDPDDAVLEVSQPGLKIHFDAPTLLSLAGAKAKVMVNQREISNPSMIAIQPGDILEIGQIFIGRYVYLGIKSGFQTKITLGSRSYFSPVTGESMVKKHEDLPFQSLRSSSSSLLRSKPKWKTEWFEKQELEAYPGPDWNLVDRNTQFRITNGIFHLSKLSNRMGIQLEELIDNRLPELPTNPVFPGTVQLTPGGKLLILMRDAGVTGGYPRILQLDEDSISHLAQKNCGEPIRFRMKDF